MLTVEESPEGGGAGAELSLEEEMQAILLNEAIKEALREAFEQLTPEEQKELRERAIAQLKKLEDEIVNDMSGHLVEHTAETHEDFDTRLKKEEREDAETFARKDEEERAREEIEDIERRLMAVEADRSFYDAVYESVRDLDKELYQRLEEIFFPNVKRKATLTSTGSRISLPAVFRWEASRKGGAPVVDNRIFERTYTPETKDYVITLLVDLSGSMRSGGKIDETMKAVVLLAGVLNRLGIPTAILGFQDFLIKFKEFREPLTDTVRNRMSGMVNEVYDRNPGGHNRCNYNDDGPCLREASESLEKEPGKQKILLGFSDGQPEGRRSDERDLVEAVAHIRLNTDQKLVALGLGKGTDHVATYYPVSLPNVTVKDIPVTVCNLIEDIIRNPYKY